MRAVNVGTIATRPPARRGTLPGMELVVNGTIRHLDPPPATVAELVASLDLVGKRIAIERNGEIVPRSRYAETPVTVGDRLEVVVAVGGG